MLRRNTATPAGGRFGSSGYRNSRFGSSGRHRNFPSSSQGGGAGGIGSGPGVGVLLGIALLLSVATFLIPKPGQTVSGEIKQAEMEAQKLARKAEEEVLELWRKHHENPDIQLNKPPIHVDDHPHFSGEAGDRAAIAAASDRRMQEQSSKWVDGEKKLKEKLKKLYERQQEGKDLGVPVLTRYLGEDIPAWADETVDLDEWKETVRKKYVEMRKEEDEWREMIGKAIEAENRG